MNIPQHCDICGKMYYSEFDKNVCRICKVNCLKCVRPLLCDQCLDGVNKGNLHLSKLKKSKAAKFKRRRSSYLLKRSWKKPGMIAGYKHKRKKG